MTARSVANRWTVARALAISAIIACGAAMLGSCTTTNAEDDNNKNNPTGPGFTPVLTTILLSASSHTIAVGETLTVVVAGLDQSGLPIATGTVAWSTGSGSIATVGTTGIITGVAPGVTSIVAAAGGVQGSLNVTVVPAPSVLTNIAVTLTPGSLTAGQFGTASALGLDQNNAPMPLGSVAWSSGTPSVASINAIGGISALAGGTTQIVATSSTVQGHATLTVVNVPVATVTLSPSPTSVPIGLTQQLSARLIDANGNPATGRVVTWTSSDTTKAKVSATGLVTGVALGTVTITATCEGKTGVANVTVSSDITSISLTPGTLTTVVGRTVTTTAAVAVVNGVSTAVTFTSSNAAVATVTSVGAVATITAAGAGTATITATSVADSTRTATLRLTVDLYALSFTVQPTTGLASTAIAPAVQVSVVDGLGHPVAAATNVVTIGIQNNPGNTTLGGTTSLAAAGGVATFANLTLNRAATGYTLVASSPGLLSASSASFNETVGPPTQIVFGTQPTTTFVATAFAPALTVLVEDVAGNVVPTATNSITIAIGANPGASVLGGTATRLAVAGIATFNDLTLNVAGIGYNLTAASAGLTGAISSAFNVTGPFIALSGGAATNCGFTSYGVAYCWGDNTSGALGNGTGVASSNLPVKVSGVTTFSSIGPASGYTCGVTTANAAYCWGSGSTGGLGNGSNANSSVPVLVSGSHTFAKVSGSCGITTANQAYCWGDNSLGQLGDGTNTNSNVPVLVSGGHLFAMVSGHRPGHSCGVTTAGAAYCWGNDATGQLGDGTNTNSNVPVLVAGSHVFASVSVGGGGQTCGITTAGVAYCWGSNGQGLLGNGGGSASNIPVPVSGGLTFTAISSGLNSNCAVAVAGAAYCWGANSAASGAPGELGNGTTIDSSVPVTVGAALTFGSISAGGTTNCGITTLGAAYCWGNNSSGQLGTGTALTNSTVPLRISTPP